MDTLSLAAFMPYPCLDARVAMNAAMLMASPQKTVECCEVHGVVCVVASFDPHFAFFHKEASAMEDTNADINNVLVGDGMLGELGERRATEEACNEQLEVHRGMPLMAIAVRFVLQSLADVWP